MAKFFPVLINIKDKKCIVIGGGCVAERKVKTLLKYGAKVTLISPEINENLKKLADQGKIRFIQRKYRKSDIKDAFVVVAATSDTSVNSKIAKDAKFLVNIVDKSTTESDGVFYIVPAIFQNNELTIAVSTEFPALSKLLRDEIAKNYGKEFASFLKYLKKIRKEIQQRIANHKERQRIFREIASPQVVSILQQEGIKKAKEEIERIINET